MPSPHRFPPWTIEERNDACFIVRDATGQTLGGLLGYSLGTWLHIKTLWITEAVRRGGHGRALLAAAENEGCKRGCCVVDLSTFDYQAPGFYRKQGYEELGRLTGVGGGHCVHYFAKRLGGAA